MLLLLLLARPMPAGAPHGVPHVPALGAMHLLLRAWQMHARMQGSALFGSPSGHAGWVWGPSGASHAAACMHGAPGMRCPCSRRPAALAMTHNPPCPALPQVIL